MNRYTPSTPSEGSQTPENGFEGLKTPEQVAAEQAYETSVNRAYTTARLSREATRAPDSDAERWFFNNFDARSKEKFLDPAASDFGNSSYICEHFEEFGLARIANIAVQYRSQINSLPTPTPSDRKDIAKFVTEHGYIPIDGSVAPDFIGRDRDGKKGSFWGELCSFMTTCGPFDKREQVAIFEIITLIHPSCENSEKNFAHLSSFTLLPDGVGPKKEKKEKATDYSEQMKCWELLKSGTSLRDIVDRYYLSQGLYITVDNNQYRVYERGTHSNTPKEITVLSEYLQKNEANSVPKKALFKQYIAETIARGNSPDNTGVTAWDNSIYKTEYPKIEGIEDEISNAVRVRLEKPLKNGETKESVAAEVRKSIMDRYRTTILNSNGLPVEKLALVNVLANTGEYPQKGYPLKQVGSSARFGTSEWAQHALKNPMTTVGRAVASALPGVFLMAGIGLGFKIIEKICFKKGEPLPLWFKQLKDLAMLGTAGAMVLSATGAGETLANYLADKKGNPSQITNMLEGLNVKTSEQQKTLNEFHSLLKDETPSVQNILTGQTEDANTRIDTLDVFLYFGQSGGGELKKFHDGFMGRRTKGKERHTNQNIRNIASRLPETLKPGTERFQKYQIVLEKMYGQIMTHYGQKPLEESLAEGNGDIKPMSQVIREVYTSPDAKYTVAPTESQLQASRERDFDVALHDPLAPTNTEHQGHYREFLTYILASGRISKADYDKTLLTVTSRHPGKTPGSWVVQRDLLETLANTYAGKIAAEKIPHSTIAIPHLSHILDADNGKTYMETLRSFEQQVLSDFKAPLLSQISVMQGHFEGLLSDLRTDGNQNAHENFYMQLMSQIDNGAEMISTLGVKTDIATTKKELENMGLSMKYFEQMMSMRLKLFANYDSSGLPDVSLHPGQNWNEIKENFSKLESGSDQSAITENEIERLTNIMSTQDFSILTFTPGKDVLDHDGKISPVDSWFKTDGLSVNFHPFAVEKPEKFLETLDNYLHQFDYAGWDITGQENNAAYTHLKDAAVKFLTHEIPANTKPEDRKTYTLYFMEELQGKLAFVHQNLRMGRVLSPIGQLDNKISPEVVDAIFDGRMTTFSEWKNAEFAPMWQEGDMQNISPEDQTLNMIRYEEYERGGYSIRRAMSDWREKAGDASSYGPYQIQYGQAVDILENRGLKDVTKRRDIFRDFLVREVVNGALNTNIDIEQELDKYDFLYRTKKVDEKDLKTFLMTDIGGRWFADRLRVQNTSFFEQQYRDVTGQTIDSQDLPLYVAAAHNGGPGKVMNAGIQFAFWQIGVDLSDETRTQKYQVPGLNGLIGAINTLPTGIAQNPHTKQYGTTHPHINPIGKMAIPGLSKTATTKFDGVIGPNTIEAVIKALNIPATSLIAAGWRTDLATLRAGNYTDFFKSDLWKKVATEHEKRGLGTPSPLISPENIRQYPMPAFMNYGLRVHEHLQNYSS